MKKYLIPHKINIPSKTNNKIIFELFDVFKIDKKGNEDWIKNKIPELIDDNITSSTSEIYLPNYLLNYFFNKSTNIDKTSIFKCGEYDIYRLRIVYANKSSSNLLDPEDYAGILYDHIRAYFMSLSVYLHLYNPISSKKIREKISSIYSDCDIGFFPIPEYDKEIFILKCHNPDEFNINKLLGNLFLPNYFEKNSIEELVLFLPIGSIKNNFIWV